MERYAGFSRIRFTLAALAPLVALAAPTGAAPPAAAEIAKLEWLSGGWSGTKDGVASEEHWTSAEGGAMVGMHKDVRPGKTPSFEFLRIAADDAGRLCYIASPGGAAPTPFCAVELGDRRVVFENLEHDFPQRILYWLDGSGALHARVEGPSGAGEVSEEWVWTRMRR